MCIMSELLKMTGIGMSFGPVRARLFSVSKNLARCQNGKKACKTRKQGCK